MAIIAPSVLGADFGHLADEIASADAAGIAFYHLDIMDGHFVPNLSFGPGVVKTIDKLTPHFLDVHLMLSEPEKYFTPFAKAGADNITFHLEVRPDPALFADQIKQLGIKAGISINPDMPVEKVLPFLKHFDYLLIMSVFPGFGGQRFIEAAIPKIRIAKDYVQKYKLSTVIEVDGGVEVQNASRVIAAGADVLVMGTGFFGRRDRKEIVQQIARMQSAKG